MRTVRGRMGCANRLTLRTVTRITCGKLGKVGKRRQRDVGSVFHFARAGEPQRMRGFAHMTLITPGLEEARTDELLLDVHNSLSDLRREFRALKERVEAGEDVKNTEIRSKSTDLNSVLVNCQKLETTLAEVRQKRSRIAQGGYALDLDAARVEVRCALGRLRTCAGPRDVSE